jgi:hypothetical protein
MPVEKHQQSSALKSRFLEGATAIQRCPMTMRFSLRRLFALVAVTAIAFWIYGIAYPLGGALVWILLWAAVVGIAIRSNRKLVAICAGLMLMFGTLALPVVAIKGHAVPIRDLSQVRTGDSTDAVQSILGRPATIRDSTTGPRWLYSGPAWCHVTIQFGGDDKVLYVSHDH